MNSYLALVNSVRLLQLMIVVRTINSLLTDSFQGIEDKVQLIETLENYIEICNERVAAMEKEKFSETVTKESQGGSLFPLDEHYLYEEARRLTHIQQMYDLTAADIMEGRLMGNVTVGPALTSEDCLYIGTVSAEKYDHKMAVDWLQVCDGEYDQVILNPAPAVLVRSSLFTGDLSLCRKIINKCLEEDKNNRVLTDLKLKVSYELGNDTDEYNLWESFNICAGDYERELSTRNMKCRYNHHNSPFLTIAPLKEELLSLVPKMSLFREAVYNSEIEQIISDSYSKLKPSRIQGKMGPIVETRTFPSQYTFLYLNLKSEYHNLRDRLMDMNSLTFSKREGTHIVHYVPGGFIRVHGDFPSETDPSVQQLGHRIAQNTFYLSDVELGGETVFPRLRLSVKPTKGSVLSWTNMRVDGSEETRTHHAGCPVIYGKKIVGVNLFRMKEQNRIVTKPEDHLTFAVQTDPKFNPSLIIRKRI